MELYNHQICVKNSDEHTACRNYLEAKDIPYTSWNHLMISVNLENENTLGSTRVHWHHELNMILSQRPRADIERELSELNKKRDMLKSQLKLLEAKKALVEKKTPPC